MDEDENVIFHFQCYNNSCIPAAVYRYLLVNFSKLLQVVFQKGNLLFLGYISPTIIRLQPYTLSTETEEILGHEYSQKQMCILYSLGDVTYSCNMHGESKLY